MHPTPSPPTCAALPDSPNISGSRQTSLARSISASTNCFCQQKRASSVGGCSRMRITPGVPCGGNRMPVLNLFLNPDLSLVGPYALCGQCHDLNLILANII